MTPRGTTIRASFRAAGCCSRRPLGSTVSSELCSLFRCSAICLRRGEKTRATTRGFRSAPSMHFPSAKRVSRSTRIRLRIRGTGRPITSPATCATRAAINSRSSLSTARIWAARCAGFRSRNFSCAHATAAYTTPTARAPPGRPSAASSLTTGRSFQASCILTPARCRRSQIPRSW